MTVAEILAKFSTLNVLVVGDICLDRWCIYDPRASEASRETGLRRIGVITASSTAGASGTISNNLSDMGVGRVAMMGVVGEDAHGDELFRALGLRDIGVDLVLRSTLVQTFTYIKHINQDSGLEDMPRVDYINSSPMPASLQAQLASSFQEFASYFDAIVVCDQAETESGGVVTESLRDSVTALAKERPEKIVWVDSRRRAELFEHCYLKPNEQEAAEAAIRLSGVVDYQALRQRLQLRALVITEGERGAKIVNENGMRQIPTIEVANPVDVCGAGDSFSAGAASALAAGATIEEAVHLGNLAASVTIMKRGTGTATAAEILEAETRLGVAK